MKFTAILKETVWLLVTEGRVSYARLRREFDIDDSFFEDIRAELIRHKGLAADLDGQFLVWSPGAQVAAQQSPVTPPRELTPLARNPVAENGTPSGGERRRITVMFCDLMGSTELSTKLDPEDLQDVIRAYQDAVSRVAQDFDGFVAKYMGDGVLIYFGYPQALEKDAERALHTGLAVVDAMAVLNDSADHAVVGRLAVRIGIATGLVVVG
ncbi:MAG: adenylate/guanylate cyclase domain-containing protein, partial [Alphaproteobacteria bacterium]